ncbi:beta strand repeat-containing protein, partial [Bathymodiolus thermophilus thioautotrophic gill symbiont]
TLSGTVSVIGTVSSISVSSIVFKQGDTTVHVITTNLPAIVNNSWTLANNSAWTSQLTQGDYTVIVNLAGKGASNQYVTGLNSITTKIDTIPPAQPTFILVNDTGVSDDDKVTKIGTLTVGSLEEDTPWQYSTNGGTNWTNGTGTSFTLTEGTHAIDAIQVKQTNVVGNSSVGKNDVAIVVDTLDPLFGVITTVNVAMNTDITTTVYDAQASNLNGGNADDGITYSIKNASTSKFAITTDIGIVTYKALQTAVHTDVLTIIATDVAGNATEQRVIVSVVGSIAQGFVMNGESAGDSSGRSVSSAGDVNGDGLDDLIVGAYQADPDNKDKAGKSYVVFGKNNASAINLSAIASGTGGFVINGENAKDKSSLSVSSAGDVNGDGLDDLIVGAHRGDGNIGKAYVVFGKDNVSAINLSDISLGTGGFVIYGEVDRNWSGLSVSSAGDVNGDGLDDLIVGSIQGASNKGKSYVVFGKKDKGYVDLETVALGTGGFVINGEYANDQSGYSVSSAGDVNGDGLDDLIVGAHYANYNNRSIAGKSYVIFGKNNSFAATLANLGTGGFSIGGERSYDNSGHSVSSAGDVNGDGLDDLIVGAFRADPDSRSNAGKSYVIFGKNNASAIKLSSIALGIDTGGFVINGESAEDESGNFVSSAGDVNGDGLDDLIVGARSADPDGKSNAGKSYVVFGKNDSRAVDLSTIALGTGGFAIHGENTGDLSGYSVSSAGDVNGDGLDDLIVGAFQADPDSKSNAGKSYVVFGKTGTEPVYLSDISSIKGATAHAVDFLGGDNTDTLTGTPADELFVAGLGADTLIGNGGADVFNAGAGNDTIVINADNLAKLSSKVLSNHLLARVDGGGNTDTLKLAGADLNLDLTQIDNGRIQDIEIIDLTGSGNNTLKLNLNDLLDISSSTNFLKVIGDTGDKVDIELSNNAFAKDSTKIEDGITYDIYNNVNATATVELWVEQDLAVF